MQRFAQVLRSRRPGSAACLAAHVAVFVLTGCASGSVPGDPMTIRGELMPEARHALAPESVAIVELARAHDGRVVAEQRQPLAGRRFPIPFELKPHRSVIEDGAAYLLRAAIAKDGRTLWLSDAIEVRARPETIQLGMLTLKPFQPVAFSSPLRCGDRTASVGVARVEQRDILQLAVAGERFELHETATASGARYEAVNDPRTFIWFKGQRATLVLRGERYPECVVAD